MTPASMPQWISDTIGALMSWMCAVNLIEMKYLKVDDRYIIQYGNIKHWGLDVGQEWMKKCNADMAAWMRAAGVTEIIITQDGATWR